MFLRGFMPENHLSDDSKDSVKLGMGLVATMCALVLGLLIASAKTYYDTQNAELTEMSAKIVLLDRLLAHYGPETNDCRAFLRSVVERSIDRLWQAGGPPGSHLDPAAVSSEALSEKTLALLPKDDRQHFIQSQAVTLEISLANPLVDVRTVLYTGSKTIGGRFGFLADHHFHGLGHFRSPQRDRRGYLVRQCPVGFRRNLPDLGDVHALRRSDSRFQRSAPRRPGASRPINTIMWPHEIRLRLFVPSANLRALSASALSFSDSRLAISETPAEARRLFSISDRRSPRHDWRS